MSGNLSFSLSGLSTTSVSSTLYTVPTAVHKEIGPELLERERLRHRKQGEVPYPLYYESQLLNADTVDHLVLTEISGGLTVHPLDEPPRHVLDLGCGGGAWILSAARQWKQTTFVGLDICRKQPNLFRANQVDLAKRITWVHANLLERLPFHDGEFDFVRIQNIGLGVPEDEWQDVIEEVCRVLKPGGTFELIEEDLIFPCPDSPVNRTPRASPVLRGRNSRSLSRSTGNTILTDSDELEQMFYSNEKARSLETVSERRSDQRDHSKLKEAFMQMLNARFINPQVLTVLPFYLQAAFDDVHTYPGIRVYLPPPSGVICTVEFPDNISHFSLESSSTLVDSLSSPVSSRRSSEASTSTWASVDVTSPFRTRLHLSRLLSVIRGCKEAMWIEYEKLHRNDRTIPNERLDRDDFDMHFHNWECDMQDRMGMRESVTLGLGWPTPANLPKPDWQEWREKGDKENEADITAFYSKAPPELLRSVRGFVCKRPELPQKPIGRPHTNGHLSSIST